MPLTQDVAHIGFLATESNFDWQRRQCSRLGVPLALAIAIPDPGDPWSKPFSAECQEREDRARAKARAA